MNTIHLLQKKILSSPSLNQAKVETIIKITTSGFTKNNVLQSRAKTRLAIQNFNYGNPIRQYKSLMKHLTWNKPSFSSVQSNQRKYTINNKYMDRSDKDDQTEVLLIYLNRSFDIDVLKRFHKLSSYTITAGNAATRLHDEFQKKPVRDDEVIPNALIGDLDSIRLDVLDYYKGKGAKVVHNISQNESDLEKCLNHIDKRLITESTYNSSKNLRILIAGGFTGRVDQALSNIHVIHKFSEKYMDQENISLHLIDDTSIGTCIFPGKTCYVKADKFEKKRGCGLFPLLDQEVNVKTKGLRWDIGSKII